MKTFKKKIISIILCVALALSVSGISAVCTEYNKEYSPAEKPKVNAEITSQEDILPSSVKAEETPAPQVTDSPQIAAETTTASGGFVTSADASDAVSPAFTAGSRLTGLAKVFYDSYVSLIESIYSGETPLPVTNYANLYDAFEYLDEQSKNEFKFTAEELGLEPVSDATKGIYNPESGQYGLSNEYVAAFMPKATEIINDSCDKALHALLSDYPFELFWFKKTADGSQAMGGLNSTFQISINSNEYVRDKQTGDVYFTSIFAIHLDIAFIFSVADDYRDKESYAQFVLGDELYESDIVDFNEFSRVDTAKENADAIIEKYKNYSDYDKLKAYHDEICKLASYNNAAARVDSDVYYGDPWQMIYVFDGDPDTTVVCEGYAKAFKYLCDNSSFTDKSICCLLASGVLYQNSTALGDHMWNIVKMGGKNYLVDVTNDDGSSITSLFLAEPVAGSADRQYLFKVASSTYFGYKYADNQADVFGKDRIVLTPEYQYGDITLSKCIDVCDCVKASVFASKNNQLSVLEKFLGDVDFDGDVDNNDAILIAQYAAGNKETL